MSEYYLLLKEKYVTKNPCQKAKDLRSILKWQNNSHVCIKIANSVALPSERAENSNLLWLMFFKASNFSFIISRIKKGLKLKFGTHEQEIIGIQSFSLMYSDILFRWVHMALHFKGLFECDDIQTF